MAGRLLLVIESVEEVVAVSVRVGLIVPSSNTVMEVDFYRALPPEVTLHTARMYLEETTVEGEEKMLDVHLPRAAEDIATARPNVVVFGCTSAGALRGNEYEAGLCRWLSERTRAPVVSVISSVRKVLSDIEAHRIAVITPYVEALNERIARSLVDDGFEVVRIAGLGIDENFAIAEVSPQEILEFARRTIKGIEADAIFVSCTNFRGMAARPALQREFGLPVVTSNQATLVNVGRVLGFEHRLNWEVA